MIAILRAATAVLLAVLVALPAGAAPLRFPSPPTEGFGRPAPPDMQAQSWILYDATAGVVLAEFNADEVRAPASITKILTILIALERSEQSEMVAVSARAAATGEREINLFPGERVTLGALLRAAMIHSANDAATAIAEHVAGSVEAFAGLMNERAGELGMTRSHFVNPHGLDATGHVTTARDMLTISLAAMKNPEFRDIARARRLVFPNAPDGSRRFGESTNLLLEDYEGANGIKTGFTSRALLTIVASAERDGRELYAVVMGTEARRSHFDAATALLDYGYERLRIYGTVLGVPHRAALRTSSDPLTTAADIEAQLHLAGEGLLAPIPKPPPDLPDLPPPPMETTRRRADGAVNPWDAALFWLTRLVRR